MAKLTEVKRRAIWQRLMEEASAERELLPLSKPEYRAAVDAVDTWIDSNTAAFNAAIPAAARSALTARQKARLFFVVAQERFGAA